jgi:5-formyltetrahydrofolate cyclo-ligase
VADLWDKKEAARAALLKARRALPPHTLTLMDVKLLMHLSELLQATRPQVIATYVPFGTEPGAHLPRPLPQVLAETTAAGVLVPVMLEDNDLDWRDWSDPGGRVGVNAISRADLVIVPALAVDRTGVRLGRGGGSYDRALARVRDGVPTVALLHDGELAHSVPVQPHDRRVTAVITATSGIVGLPLAVDDDAGAVTLLALEE